MKISSLLLLLGWFSLVGMTTAATIFVSPQGNDAWSGKLQTPNAEKTDGPLATLPGARDAVRKLKASGPLSQPVDHRATGLLGTG
jgi:hypothetical protein